MKKIKIKNLEEDVFYEKLDNGLEVFLYTKDDVYTNYVTFTTKYGSVYNEFVPIDCDNIHYTYDRFKCYDGLNVTCENCINGNESGMTIKRITEDYMKKLIENNYFYLLQQTQHIINNITQLNIKRINLLFIMLMNNITFQFQSSS